MKSRQKSEEVRQAFTMRLIAAMDAKGVAVRQRASSLTKVARITDQGARKWLSGASMPGKANLTAIAKWLDVREEWLEYGRGPMRAPEGSEVEELLEGVRERLRGLEGARRERLLETLRFLAEK